MPAITQSVADKRHYAKYRDRKIAAVKRYYEKNRVSLNLKRQAARAKQRDAGTLREWARRGVIGPIAARPAGCEVCGAVPLNLDHDHSTGRFRGWLCRHCNTALGYAKDSPERLRALANYLESR